MLPERPDLPQNLLTALLEFAQVLDRLGVSYALIGGVAAGYRSRPRFTQDVDFLLDIPQLVLPRLLDELHARGFTFETTATIREWNQDHLTLVFFHGVRIDWLKPVLPCMQQVLQAAPAELWMGTAVRIAVPEGLILLKLLAFRTQDQVDIENLLAANRKQLDLELVRREWEALALPDDGRWSRYEEMVARHYAG